MQTELVPPNARPHDGDQYLGEVRRRISDALRRSRQLKADDRGPWDPAGILWPELDSSTDRVAVEIGAGAFFWATMHMSEDMIAGASDERAIDTTFGFAGMISTAALYAFAMMDDEQKAYWLNVSAGYLTGIDTDDDEAEV